jgi:hypothetical protein
MTETNPRPRYWIPFLAIVLTILVVAVAMLQATAIVAPLAAT